MQIDITTHDIDVNPSHKDYIIEKIEGLGKFGYRIDDPSTQVKVELKKTVTRSEGKHIECQVTMYVPKAIIRAEVHANQVMEAVDLAVEKMKKQIERYVTRNGKNKRQGEAGDLPAELMIPSDEEFKIESNITRRKRYSNTEVMSEQDAIEQMELIGHKCFLFENADTDRYSMVYKKDDGTYGIVEPKKTGDLEEAR